MEPLVLCRKISLHKINSFIYTQDNLGHDIFQLSQSDPNRKMASGPQSMALLYVKGKQVTVKFIKDAEFRK
jgi:hypothetical protein